MIRLIGLLLISIQAHACDSLYLGGISYHFDRTKDYNEKHHLIGCENAIGRLDALWFRNSKRRNSIYIGEYFPLWSDGPHSAGADLGLATGYKDRPVLFGDLRYNYRLTPTTTLNVRFGGVVFIVGLEFDL